MVIISAESKLRHFPNNFEREYRVRIKLFDGGFSFSLLENLALVPVSNPPLVPGG